ncbi:hypothetical protein UCRPC4_g01698 [Phaeomoniella chlamydospora]|uniref:Uncharacterized protein n=1 Tax=Phaeomoniella chlamydospora TaxID=158046 RepID=A0A0G2ES95_PHACM|nr:hypothetical protein UCRPC4_g01698 [Phaeomoniella chlamydospora]
MVDPSSPSHGDVPGTEAWEKRKADATPDLVRQISEESSKSAENFASDRPSTSYPIPETKITKVDSKPAHGEAEGTAAAEMRKRDAVPDEVEIAGDIPSKLPSPKVLLGGPLTGSGSPTNDLNRSEHRSHVRRKSTLTNGGHGEVGAETEDNNEDEDGDGFGDDFDDFEEGEQDGADDFGDFGDEFEEPSYEEPPQPSTPAPATPLQSFPLLDLSKYKTPSDLQSAISTHLDSMFPTTTDLDSFPAPELITDPSPIFPSERSRSLWKQLITPPPLQPPNWTKSRIRRLFLVSLGVPVDLDEILPPSKQKKLILPDINLESPRKSESDKATGSVARLKKEANDSNQSLDSQRSASKSRRRGRKGPDPPPELDLTAIKRLCATTDEKLLGFTDEELKNHISELEEKTGKTCELLEYWLKRRDMVRAEKEAFEGVIENLVRHARRVRK